MNLYADTSGLAKILLNEPDGEDLVAVFRAPVSTASAAIAYVELRAAVAAAARQGRVPANQREDYARALEDLWALVDEVPVEAGLIRQAGNLAEGFGLRGYDAVHLAALQAAGDPGEIVFACWDRTLRGAASGLGYELLPERL